MLPGMAGQEILSWLVANLAADSRIAAESRESDGAPMVRWTRGDLRSLTVGGCALITATGGGPNARD